MPTTLQCSADDYERFMDNVEEVAALYPMVYEWDIFREQVHSIDLQNYSYHNYTLTSQYTRCSVAHRIHFIFDAEPLVRFRFASSLKSRFFMRSVEHEALRSLFMICATGEKLLPGLNVIR